MVCWITDTFHSGDFGGEEFWEDFYGDYSAGNIFYRQIPAVDSWTIRVFYKKIKFTFEPEFASGDFKRFQHLVVRLNL